MIWRPHLKQMYFYFFMIPNKLYFILVINFTGIKYLTAIR